ncbi:MAG: hypothetical protein GU343_02395 [Nanoarchaeota archaeon]|jgi:hypothetical protein|nr:hypothetical protein [Nanoarchaeota archaeon]
MAMGLFKKKNKNEEDFYGDLDNLKNQLGGMGSMSMDMGNNYNIPGTGQNPYDYNNNPGSFGALGNQNQQPTFGPQGFGQQQFAGMGQQNMGGVQNINNQQFGGFGNQQTFGSQGFGTQQVQQPPLEENKPLLKEKVKESVHKKHLKEERPLEVRKELLIKIEDYKRVRELLQQLKEKMSEVEKIVSELKEDENKRLESIKGLKEKLEESKSNINSVLDIFR